MSLYRAALIAARANDGLNRMALEVSDRIQFEFDAIERLRDLQTQHAQLSEERKELFKEIRKAGLDLESIKRAVRVLGSDDPLKFQEDYNKVAELLERYSKSKLAQGLHSRRPASARARRTQAGEPTAPDSVPCEALVAVPEPEGVPPAPASDGPYDIPDFLERPNPAKPTASTVSGQLFASYGNGSQP